MFAKIIFTLLLISGFSAAMTGAFITSNWSLLAAGVVVGAVGFLGLRRIFRRQRAKAWARATKKPFARWTDRKGREVVFAKNAVFYGRKYWEFADNYSSLTGLKLEDGVLHVTVTVPGADIDVDKRGKVPVPPEHEDAVRKGIKKLGY